MKLQPVWSPLPTGFTAGGSIDGSTVSAASRCESLAFELASLCVSAAQLSGNPQVMTEVLSLSSLSAFGLGRVDEAKQWGERAATLAVALKDAHSEDVAKLQIVETMSARGMHAEVLPVLQRVSISAEGRSDFHTQLWSTVFSIGTRVTLEGEFFVCETRDTSYYFRILAS